MMSLPYCECKLCADCFGTYFKSQIREKSVVNFACPTCNKPEIDVNNDDSQVYFQLLDTLVSIDLMVEKIITTIPRF